MKNKDQLEASDLRTLGAMAVIPKPYNMKEFLCIIKKTLEEKPTDIKKMHGS